MASNFFGNQSGAAICALMSTARVGLASSANEGKSSCLVAVISRQPRLPSSPYWFLAQGVRSRRRISIRSSNGCGARLSLRCRRIGSILPVKILRRLAAQTAIAESLEVRIRDLRAQGQDDSKEAGALAARHGLASKSIADLLAQLRATPKSRTVPRAAGPRVLQAPEWRPWESKGGQAQTKAD